MLFFSLLKGQWIWQNVLIRHIIVLKIESLLSFTENIMLAMFFLIFNSLYTAIAVVLQNELLLSWKVKVYTREFSYFYAESSLLCHDSASIRSCLCCFLYRFRTLGKYLPSFSGCPRFYENSSSLRFWNGNCLRWALILTPPRSVATKSKLFTSFVWFFTPINIKKIFAFV